MAATRLRAALDLGTGLHDAGVVLARSPGLLPTAYTGVRVESGDRLLVHVDRSAPAAADGRGRRCSDAGHLEPLDAIVGAVDRRLRCTVVSEDAAGLVVEVVPGADERPVPDDVRLTEFSTGADFAFTDRGTPVVLGRRGGA